MHVLMVVLSESGGEWNKGCIIKMECNDTAKPRVRFSKDNGEYGKLNTTEGLLYYPCICRHIWGC